MAAISLEGLCSRPEAGRRVIDGLDLDIADGELMALLGGSGSGKTTVLRMIAGLTPVDDGRVLIGDEDMTGVPTSQRDIAMVVQGDALLPHLSARRNVGFGLRLRKMLGREVDRRVEAEARVLRLTELLDRLPSSLSGGEQGATALGRALVRAPGVYLLDEPFARMDAGERARLRTELVQRIGHRGTTTLLVTNDPVEAMAAGDRLAVLHAGRIAQVGVPLEIYQRPRSVPVAQLLGDPPMAVLPGILEPGGRSCWVRLGTQRIPIAMPSPAVRRTYEAAAVLVGIRPEHATAARDDEPEARRVGALTGTITRVVPLGDRVLVRVALSEVPVPLEVRLAADALERLGGPRRDGRAGTGRSLRFHLDPAAMVLFDPVTELALR
jgi:ABC-type sugar transport system ATPase subunit